VARRTGGTLTFDPTTILSFPAALATAGEGKPHLLLGNGFSLAWRSDVFRYGALLDAAEFSTLTVDGRALFVALGTTDFETVIEALRTAALLAEVYEPSDAPRAARLRADASAVKDELARVIALRHPENPAEITDDEYQHASAFLATFDHLYTVNYDLLLYWVAMQASSSIRSDDGFRADPDDHDAPWVTWDSSGRSRGQNLFYLHGALHLFDQGDRLTKFTWNRTGIRLIAQIRDALEGDAYPVVVTEGTSSEKLKKITHSAYLSHAFRSLASLGSSRALFLFGLSLSASDDHIVQLIRSGSVGRLFVSVRGSPSADLVARLQVLHDMRDPSRPLDIMLYDADSARVWR
jgi:hypothetical protein